LNRQRRKPQRSPSSAAWIGLWLGLILLSGYLTPTRADGTDSEEERPSLSAPLDVLARAFRAGSPNLLRSLLHGDGKIHASFPALGIEPGYYSGDQVYFLFRDHFKGRRTIRFNFLKGADVPPRSQNLTAVARWVYRVGGSRDFTAEIAFTLVLRENAWCLQEIRELL
jgi:hypothetical protein